MVTRDKSDTAREYLRVSLDSSGREKSPEEQHGDNQRAADSRGWTLGKPYRDIGSASRYAKKARQDFDRLIADLEAGHFDANILILWESSRGSRKVGEWANLIELCEARGVKIFVTADAKLYDPREARDRRSLLEDAIDSAWESDKTSKRAIRARAADAASGRPNGPPNFGYARRFDPATGRLEAQDRDPDEAPIVEELFDRLYRGHSLLSIQKDFAARGIRSRQRFDKDGNPLPRIAFSSQHLRSLAICRAYLGEREHTPGRKGTRGHHATLETKYHKAMWPALVSRRKFFAVQRILTDPDRVTIRPGRSKHLLSMIAVCDVCDGPLAAKKPDTPEAHYTCNKGGHVKVGYHELNEHVEDEIITYLSRPENLALLAESDDAEVERAQATVAEIEGELRKLAARVVAGELGVDFAALAEPGLRARLKAAKEAEERLSQPAVLAGLIEPGEDVATSWNRAPMTSKRGVVRILLTPPLLGEVRVIRSPVKRHRAPIEDRVVWRRENAIS